MAPVGYTDPSIQQDTVLSSKQQALAWQCPIQPSLLPLLPAGWGVEGKPDIPELSSHPRNPQSPRMRSGPPGYRSATMENRNTNRTQVSTLGHRSARTGHKSTSLGNCSAAILGLVRYIQIPKSIPRCVCGASWVSDSWHLTLWNGPTASDTLGWTHSPWPSGKGAPGIFRQGEASSCRVRAHRI